MNTDLKIRNKMPNYNIEGLFSHMGRMVSPYLCFLNHHFTFSDAKYLI